VGTKEWIERWEVVDVGRDEVRLRVTEAGRAPIEHVQSTVEEPFVERGTETLFLAGRRLQCRQQERAGERRWMCGEMPAWPVREENAEGVTELVVLQESVDGRSCVVFETRLAAGGRARRWKSLDVPGHVVREARTTDVGEAGLKVQTFGGPGT
jgi:hypothetical protein